MRYLRPQEREAIAFEGDLLVVKSSGSAANIRSGKTAICPAPLSGKIAAANFLMRLVPNRSLVAPFLLWLYLNSNAAKAFVRQIAGSSTYPNIKWSAFKDFTIPLPSLAEQQRIAVRLRELMEAVDRARKAAAERLHAARALPAAFLRQMFPQPAQPLHPGWRWVRLGEVLCVRSGQFLPATNMDAHGQFPVYGGNGVTGMHGAYMFEDPKVIIGRVGALCGCVHLTQPRSWVTDNALYVEEKKCPLDDNFLVFWLTKMDLRSLANQMGQPVISSASLYGATGPLPPFAEQLRIAAILNEQIADVGSARKALEEEFNAIDTLPTALLREALSGRL